MLAVLVCQGLAASVAAVAAPSLHLPLNQPQELPAAGPGFRVAGEFSPGPDGTPALGLGKDLGPAIPATPFFGEVGTIAFTLSYLDPAPENRMRNRHLVALRMAGES